MSKTSSTSNSPNPPNEEMGLGVRVVYSSHSIANPPIFTMPLPTLEETGKTLKILKYLQGETMNPEYDPKDVAFDPEDKLIRQAPKEKEIIAVCGALSDLLLFKNMKYGNSALEPIGIFSNTTAGENIRSRLDEKIKRVKECVANGEAPRKDDVVDIMGYLVLYCIENDWMSFSEYMVE